MRGKSCRSWSGDGRTGAPSGCGGAGGYSGGGGGGGDGARGDVRGGEARAGGGGGSVSGTRVEVGRSEVPGAVSPPAASARLCQRASESPRTPVGAPPVLAASVD